MQSQFDLLRELHSGRALKEPVDLYSYLMQLQQAQAPLYEDELDSSGLSSSDAVTFAQTPSVGGGDSSLLDICTPPPSPYSQTSSNPLSLSSRLNLGDAEAFPCSTSSAVEEPAVPVCYDFVQGRCARTNCRYLHDFRKIEKPSSDKRGICFDYLRGDCNRGAMCRFSHDVSSFAQDYKVEDDISLAKVKRWGQGICFDFVRGACGRGEKCPWSHNLLEIAVATKKGIENMETSERNRIAETVRRRLCASLENNASTVSTCCDNKCQHHHRQHLPQQRQQDMMMNQLLLQLSNTDMAPTPTPMAESSVGSPNWVSMWNYPASVFGPLDQFGRPLHWFSSTSNTTDSTSPNTNNNSNLLS